MCYALKVSLGLGKEFAHKSIVWNNNEWMRNDHNTSNMRKHKRKYKKRTKRNGDLTSAKTCPNGLCGEAFAKACRMTTFTTLNATRF
jgi:hypothetical protein